MPFATRADLLARTNARRLAQLAMPTDVEMVDDAALRVAIGGGSLSGYSAEQQAAIELMLGAIDDALKDADSAIVSYGVPATASDTMLTRLACTLAYYYLQGMERLTEDTRLAYADAMDQLRRHAQGLINLVPTAAPNPGEPALAGDFVVIESKPRRYAAQVAVTSDFDL
jgi:phage gp36-like protein